MRHRSQIPMADNTDTNAMPTVQKMIRIAFKMPACPTIQPLRKKTITPKMLISTDVKTPSQVPNNTGCDMKKFVRHLQAKQLENLTIINTHELITEQLFVSNNWLASTTSTKTPGTRHLPRFIALLLGKYFIGTRCLVTTAAVLVLISQVHETPRIATGTRSLIFGGLFAAQAIPKTRLFTLHFWLCTFSAYAYGHVTWTNRLPHVDNCSFHCFAPPLCVLNGPTMISSGSIRINTIPKKS